MRIAYFSHALTSCWNHGNAHFQRGLLRALAARGHDVAGWEPRESWSRTNLIADQGEAAASRFATSFPDLNIRQYELPDLAAAVAEADVVIVHEWTEPDVVAALGRLRMTGGFQLLFHDTHHRAVSEPMAVRAFDLSSYDAVLAFGATLAAVYKQWGWEGRVFVFHEAADLTLFQPPGAHSARDGGVWIGNWGDGERTVELETFLLRPAKQADITLDIYGVRYPPEALALLRKYNARHHGWLANEAAPEKFARHAFTVHVPRRHYTQMLPGIPTIRVFEALACGIPLICAPWDDCENLFRPGEDYLVALDGKDMVQHMTQLIHNPDLGAALAASGLARIRERHSCDIRADELLTILDSVAHPRFRGAA